MNQTAETIPPVPGGKRKLLAALSPLGWLAILLAALTALRVLYVWAGAVELSGDEALYWDYSRRLQWCYYFKGPVVAWCIRLGTAVLGTTELGVGAPAIVLSAGSSLLIYALGKRLYSAKVGAWAGAIYQAAPLFAANSIGMTIDPPYVFLWILAMLLTQMACTGPRAWKWLALGAAVGLGLMAKYTMALYYPCALLYLGVSRDRRKLLAGAGPWTAVAVSMVFLAPLLWWNSRNGWVNFAHNLGHTEVQEGLRFTPGKFGEFVGGQLAILTPFLLVMMVIALFRQRRAEALSFWFSIPILAFFTLKSLQGRVYANWPMAAYPLGFLAFAAVFIGGYSSASIHVKRLTRTAAVVAAVGALCAHFPLLPSYMGFSKYDPTRNLQGWAEVGREVSRLEGNVSPRHFIVGDRRMLTSLLAFYVEDHPWAYCLPKDPNGVLRKDPRAISSDYDLWPGYEGLVGYDALYVACDAGEPNRVFFDRTYQTLRPARIEPRLAAGFEKVEERSFVVHDFRWEGRDANLDVLRRYSIFLCRNFKGLP